MTHRVDPPGRGATGLLCRVVLIGLAILWPTWAFAQAAPLSPDAQDAVRRRMIAAQQQDYPTAIHYFENARKAAPNSPEIYFDLGLAESKVPGRELRAMAWFGAYLAANPQARNAAEVKNAIDVLEVKSRGNVSRLVKLAADRQNMEKVLQSVNSSQYKTVDNIFVFQAELDLALALGAEGDVNSSVEMLNDAQATGELQSQTSLFERDASYLAVQAAWAGNYVGANRIADIMPPLPPSAPTYERALDASYTRRSIADIQAKNGDIPGALATASRVERDDERANAFSHIVNAQLDIGDIAGAHRTAPLITDAAYRSQSDRAIAAAEANTAEIARRQALGPIRDQPQAKTAAQLISELFGESDDDVSKPLNAPVMLDLADYASQLPAADPSKVIRGYMPDGPDLKPAGSPLVLFCALAEAARAATSAQKMVDYDVGAIVGHTLN